MLEFVIGQRYRRRALHEEYGGNFQSGMCPSAKHPVIFLFTGKSGEQHGYRDGWTDDGLFFYTGEGQTGDMQFTKGNKALRDHVENEKDVHLFEDQEDAHVRYLGQFVCTGHHLEHDPLKDRQRIVFELTPIGDVSTDQPEEIELQKGFSISQLRERAIASSTNVATARERKALVRQRSAAIRQYALSRAAGVCEGCNSPAPFTSKNGNPFLEVHHILRLTDGGPDHPTAVAAICPNCHRRAHYAIDSEMFGKTLLHLIRKKEEK